MRFPLIRETGADCVNHRIIYHRDTFDSDSGSQEQSRLHVSIQLGHGLGWLYGVSVRLVVYHH